MGKDEKEDTGFGFKDKAKAEETLRLLEAHDAGYRRLTVRGLLGRARRVLSLTKAEDKIKNIKEAMEVFENWLAELDANKEKKPEKEKKPSRKEEKSSGDGAEKEEKEDSGFGFKDKAKAEETLRLLEAHEPSYRRLTVRGLLGRAKRVLSLTKAEDKIKNIKEAMEVFENWLAELDGNKEKKPERERRSSKKEEKTGGDEPSDEKEKDKATKEMQGLKLKESKEDKSDAMDHDGDKDGAKSKDGGSRSKDGGSRSKDGDRNKDGDRKDRKRRSSARSDDESHSKKKK